MELLATILAGCVLSACGGGGGTEPTSALATGDDAALLSGKGGVKGRITEPAPTEPAPAPTEPTTTEPTTTEPTTTPTGSWTRCATEGETCSFSGTRQVRYGQNETWITKTLTGPVSCSNATFGDPLVGVSKVCDYETTTSEPAPTSPTSPTTSEPAPAPGTTLTNIRLESTGSTNQSNVPVTFGQVFALGATLPTDGLVGTLSDGTTVPIQIDSKATHPDGSLRHAVLSAVVPNLPAAQSQTLNLSKSGTAATTGGATPSALLSNGFTAGVNVTLGGVTYSASADSLLKNGTYITWLAGPVANEWIVSAPLKTASGTAHPHLSARFAIRSYSGMSKAKVDVTVENNWAFEPGPQNLTYDVQVSVGGSTVYSKTGLTHYHHARWRKEFWWGAAPQAHVAHNAGYLIATRAIPKYDPSITISATALSAMKTGWTGARIEPMGSGQAAPAMPDTGGRPDIGLVPGWAAAYLLSGDKAAKEVTIGTANLAGSWSAHYRDKLTDRPVSLVNYPYMTILGSASDTYNPVTQKYEAFPACGGTCSNPNIADSSHQPAFSFVPYLVTGDYYHLEELQFWTMWNLFQHNPAYRDYGKGVVKGDQVRGQAWSLRALGEAAYITPDKDPLKAQFETFLSNNLDWYNANYTNSTNANKLGVITNGSAVVYNDYRGIAPWQDDFFTSAIGRVAELGYTKAKPLLAWKAKFPVARMTDPGFCWIFGSNYSLNIRDTSSSPFYSAMNSVYQSSVAPTVSSLACASSAMASALGLGTGEMVGYSTATTGYPSNMQPALAYSVDAGVANGATAWQVFMNRTGKPDYSMSPQFAIVPR